MGLGLALMLSRNHAPTFSVGAGALPFVFTTAYVFALRQGKLRSFEADLLETFANGSGWMPPAKQPRNPLFPHAST